jgi:hypothetical protein
MKKIPEDMLRAAEEDAAAPVKKVSKFTGRIFSIVADLKAAEKLGMPIEPAWQSLREVLDEAASEGEFAAFDDQQKALASLNVGAAHISVTSGKNRWDFAQGFSKNKARSPKTMAFIQAIRNLQGGKNRAPTRQEILDEMSRMLVDGVDDTEVSRQLTRLGWNDLI